MALRPTHESSLGVPAFTEAQLRSIQVLGVEVEGSRPADGSESGIYRSALYPGGLVKDFPRYKTLVDLFEAGAALNPDGPCLGHRSFNPSNGTWSPYSWQSYNQVATRRANFGHGLQYILKTELNMPPDRKINMGIYSINRPEWVIADFGSQLFGNATVALYDTLGPDAVEYILNHSEVPVVCATVDKIATLLSLSKKCPAMKVIVSMNSNGEDPLFLTLAAWAVEKGVKLYTISQVELLGAANPSPLRRPSPDDVFCICYTSGTTGTPKGAMLTHTNMVCFVRAIELQIEVQTTDCHISYLPLAHIFERCILALTLAKGAAAGFFRGDVSLLVEDIGTLAPTIFPSVPRLLNRIYDKINAQVSQSGAVKSTLFKTALNAKLEAMRQPGSTVHHTFWDFLVFRKIRAILGGRVRALISASAPISAETFSFLRAVFCTECFEAYGQTENTGGMTATMVGDYSGANVGAPLASCEIKLVSVPEMRYFGKENKGEIWCRGHNVFKGYLKDAAKTAEALTPDGWLKTGDIGSIDSKGRLSIIDRKKNIFKLSQGEYVAPEKLENTFVKSGFVAQIYVHGDSLQSELVAIVVPDPEFSVQYGKTHGLLPENTPAAMPIVPGQPINPNVIKLCQDKRFKAVVLADLLQWAVQDKLRGFEYVRMIHLEPEPFGVENGLLTPTFKVKRNEAASKYKTIIAGLYAAGSGSAPNNGSGALSAFAKM